MFLREENISNCSYYLISNLREAQLIFLTDISQVLKFSIFKKNI